MHISFILNSNKFAYMHTYMFKYGINFHLNAWLMFMNEFNEFTLNKLETSKISVLQATF